VLAPSDSHYAEHDEEAIEHMGRKTRRKWVQQLDKLKAVYAQERMQRERGQATLDSFIKRTPATVEGQEQATDASSQPRQNIKRYRTIRYRQQKLSWIQKTTVRRVIGKDHNKENRHETPPNGERIISRTQKQPAYFGNQRNKSAQITPSPIRKLPIDRGPPEPD
jgi:hypothetical protein